MNRKTVSEIMSILLLLGILTPAFDVLVFESSEIIRVKADGSRDTDKKSFKNSMTPADRLVDDYNRGEISLDRYLLYKTWSLLDPERLPAEYNPKHSFPPKKLSIERKSGTPIILEIRKNWMKLSPETQRELKFILERPTDPNGGFPDYTQHLLPQLYNTTHFVMHWTNGTDGGNVTDAVPSNDTDANGIPDYVEDFGTIFENVWSFEINTRGFQQPPSDEERPNDPYQSNPDARYDVFIFDLTGPGYGYYGYAAPEGQVNSSWYSYIGIENDFQGFTTERLGSMQVTAAHELFHACQFTYDVHEDRWWMETTATYMEDEVYPDVNDNYRYLDNFFLWPDRGLESVEGLHEYGSFVFAKFLSESFGDDVIRGIWEKMSEAAMDGLTAINAILVDNNSTLLDEFSDFVTANFFLEEMYVDGVDYREALTGTLFNGVWLEYQYDASTAQNRTEINDDNVNWNAWMDKWATDYVTLQLNRTRPIYRIFFDGLDNTTDYLVKLATKKDGYITERKLQLNASKDGHIDLFYDNYDNVTLIMANAGNSSSAIPSWRVIITYSQAPTPSLYFEPSIIYKPIYTYFTVNLSIAEVYDLWKFEFKLYYNTTVLDCVNVTPTLLWSFSNVSHNKINETAGYYWLAVQGTEPSDPFNGNATLATINFYSAEAGESTLKLMNISLTEHTTGEPISPKLQEGYFKTLSHDIAVTNITISNNTLGQGESLPINATVENQGNFTESFNVTTYANTTVIERKEISLNPEESAILPFNWNTTGFSLGDYTLSANITALPKESDTTDNTYIDGTVTVRLPIYDIAITDIASSKTVVGQNYPMSVNVTVENQGDFTETFNLTVFYGETAVVTPDGKNHTTITLPSGDSATITFVWNTTGITKGNYTITAIAGSVTGETDTSDNNFADGWVIVAMIGDITGLDGWPDGKCDMRDVGSVARLFGVDHPDPKYNPNFDVIYDHKIDMKDVGTVARHFGETDP